MARVTDKKFEQDVLGRYMANDYNNYVGKLLVAGNKKAADIYNLTALESKYKEKNPSVDLSKLSFKDKEQALSKFANEYLGENIPSGIVTKELAFAQMVNKSSSWKETLAAAKDSLTNQQKIELVSKVGGYFGNQYNYTRFNEGDKAKGYVKIEELFDSVKAGVEGGVCRDIALAQTKMLKELGFKNNYVITYKTLSGYHSDVITKDPETGKVVKFNYSEVTEMKKNSGTEALIQDSTMADHGLNYRIADSDGKPVTQVSSELGSMLKEATGGSSRAFSSLDYTLVKAGVKFGDTEGNLFNGKTSNGENIYGLALYKNYDSQYVSVGGGVAVSKLSGDRSYVNIDQNNLYARVATELRSPSLELGAVNVSGFGGASAEVLAYQGTETNLATKIKKKSEIELDAKAEGYAGIKSELNLGETILTNKTYMVYYPDLANVADASRLKAARDSVMIETGVEHKLGDDKAILIDSVVALKNYGTSFGVTGTYEDSRNRFRTSVGYETPVSSDMPTFLPGASRKISATVDKQTENGFIFSLEYDRDIDRKANTFMLKASKRF